ncbi:MAG: hypothetical protein MRJ96_05105 [Nitrospirales bacterium]|nr:hypothetical protein [Nitrospira sp.]MDR4500813.1 hypothetical protein [Nitrospirales bacterium]
MKGSVRKTLLLPLLCSFILVTSSCLALDLEVDQPTDVLTISHHKTVDLTHTQVKEILHHAFMALQKDPDIDDDHNCRMKFKKFAIKEFDSDDTPATVTSAEDMQLLAREPGHVKVVGAINWNCGKITADEGSVWGCSPRGGNFIVVQHQVDPDNPATDGVLWLHELGHNAGLPDIRQKDVSHMSNKPVMTEWIDPTHTVLNELECRYFASL